MDSYTKTNSAAPAGKTVQHLKLSGSTDGLSDISSGSQSSSTSSTPNNQARQNQNDSPAPKAKSTTTASMTLVDQVLACFQPHHLEYLTEAQRKKEDLYIEQDLQPQYCCLFTACVPPMSFESYITSLLYNTQASSATYVMAAAYCLKLDKSGVVPITPRSIHRVYLSALVLAIKSQDDFFKKQTYYAHCGGVPVKELNTMERAVFFALGYNTTIKPKELWALVKQSSA